MIVRYAWLPEFGELEEHGIDMGTWLELSGDPDQPVLRGAVVRLDEDEDPPELVILLGDGQDGSEAFQQWLIEHGDFGIRVADVQAGVL